MQLGRKLRYGMAVGGPAAFIGEVHDMAAGLDGDLERVVGIFLRQSGRVEPRVFHAEPTV